MIRRAYDAVPTNYYAGHADEDDLIDDDCQIVEHFIEFAKSIIRAKINNGKQIHYLKCKNYIGRKWLEIGDGDEQDENCLVG